MKSPKIDLKELEKIMKKNFKGYLKFMNSNVKWLKKHSVKIEKVKENEKISLEVP